jgi:hypothetical protein
MEYSLDFQNIVDYCKNNDLFIGFGNPNAKVLIIGKEQAYKSKALPGSIEFLKEIDENRHLENQRNQIGWATNIADNIIPNWENMPTGFVNPLYSWGSQRNLANRKKIDVNGNEVWNGGTSHTYLKYQKLYQFLRKEERSENISFQQDFFLTELNDVATEYSFSGKELTTLRHTSIDNRKALFEKKFFRNFPIVIIAAGHYPIQYGFKIEDIFKVKFTGETVKVGGYWYNKHFSTDKKRILIHTRQLSTDVTDELLKEIANECRSFI